MDVALQLIHGTQHSLGTFPGHQDSIQMMDAPRRRLRQLIYLQTRIQCN